MTRISLVSFLKRPYVIGVLVFAALLLLTQFISYQDYLLFKSAKIRGQIDAAHLAREKLQRALANSLSATQTLSFIEKQYGAKEDFDAVGKQIMQSNRYVDAVELLKGGVITNVYPLKGNESVIGYDILKDTARNVEALKAIERKDLYFAGPFNLKQGGISIVGRLPIFKDDKFWGFAVTLVKLSTLITATGFDTSSTSDYIYQLSKINPETHQEEFFLPNPQLLKKNQAVSLDVPSGDWRIYVMPRRSHTLLAVLPFAAVGFLLSVIGGLFAFYLTRQPLELKKLVDEQSVAIRKNEENYRNTLDRVSDAFASIDRNWNISYMNQTGGEIFKCDPVQVIGKNIWEEFQIGSDRPLYKTFHQAMAEQRYIYEDRYIERLSSWFEIFVYPSPSGLSVFFRDISDRKKAEEKVEHEKNLSDAIINSLPGSFYLYNKEGKFLRWNKNFETVSGYTTGEVAKMHPLDFFDGDEKEIVLQRIQEVFTAGVSEVEANLLTKSGDKIPYYFNGCVAIFEGEECLIGMGIDITKRRLAEQGIRESEEKYRYLFNNNPALIFIWCLEDLNIMEVNQTAVNEYGYTRNELLNMKVLDLRPVDDHQKIKDFATNMLGNDIPQVRGNWRHKKKSGELMMMDITSHRIVYNNRPAILSIAENVTQKLLTEEQLKKSYEDIRMLNTHLQTVREEERADIAREIHDELGQQLTALKMDVSFVNKRLQTDNPEVHERVSGMLSLIDQTVKIVRRIASDLRPGIIDDLGLIAALEWQLGEFEKRMGLKTVFTSSLSSIDLQKKVTIGIYRVFQEALTNVARHSNATCVEVFVEQINNQFCLSIKDNGTGFVYEEVKHKNTLGLLGMSERVHMLNGELAIESSPGKGTSVIIKVPIKQIA